MFSSSYQVLLFLCPTPKIPRISQLQRFHHLVSRQYSKLTTGPSFAVNIPDEVCSRVRTRCTPDSPLHCVARESCCSCGSWRIELPSVFERSANQMRRLHIRYCSFFCPKPMSVKVLIYVSPPNWQAWRRRQSVVSGESYSIPRGAPITRILAGRRNVWISEKRHTRRRGDRNLSKGVLPSFSSLSLSCFARKKRKKLATTTTNFCEEEGEFIRNEMATVTHTKRESETGNRESREEKKTLFEAVPGKSEKLQTGKAVRNLMTIRISS